MPDRKPNSQRRVFRVLTPDEKQKLAKARQKTFDDRQAILTEAKLRKRAAQTVAQELAELLTHMRARREELGLSLADVEDRTGIKRSALSRLENGAANINPTLLTLQRYALALGLNMHTTLLKNE